MSVNQTSCSEIVTLAVGQCGLQIDHAIWELFCMEHGVRIDGHPADPSVPPYSPTNQTNSFFLESQSGLMVPRSVKMDLEATVMDEIRTGNYRSLFHPNSLINCQEDGANNFARAHCTVGKQIFPKVMDAIRRAVGLCDNLSGIVVLNGSGGGTGAGLTSLVMEALCNEMTKKSKFELVVLASGRFVNSTVEPYNTMLNLTSCIENTDICLQFDNDSLLSIANDRLNIREPSYRHINQLIAQVFSSTTCSLRFQNSLYSDISQLQTNLIPYPRIHFPMASYSPFCSQASMGYNSLSVHELTLDALDTHSQMAACSSEEGAYMAVNLQYRGDASPQMVNKVIQRVKRNPQMQFVNWCPTGFKVGICQQPTVGVPNSGLAASGTSLSVLSNNINCATSMVRAAAMFDQLFSKRAFIHWFIGEGMEEGEFTEARDQLELIIKDYLQCKEEEEQEDGQGGDDQGHDNKEEEDDDRTGNTDHEATETQDSPAADGQHTSEAGQDNEEVAKFDQEMLARYDDKYDSVGAVEKPKEGGEAARPGDSPEASQMSAPIDTNEPEASSEPHSALDAEINVDETQVFDEDGKPVDPKELAQAESRAQSAAPVPAV